MHPFPEKSGGRRLPVFPPCTALLIGGRRAYWVSVGRTQLSFHTYIFLDFHTSLKIFIRIAALLEQNILFPGRYIGGVEVMEKSLKTMR